MAHDPSSFIQQYFQIRPDDTDALNDAFTSPAENVNTSIGRGVAFRIRFKVRETAAGSDTVAFKPQVKRNAGSFVDVTNYGGDGNTPPVSATCIISGQYANGDAITTRRLTNVSTFVNGSGHEDDAASSTPNSGNFTLTSEETEIEWCFMIQAVHYNGLTLSENVPTDTLEFRIVESDGTAFTGTYTNPVITVIDTDYYVGATFIESSDSLGPYIREGNLYILVEATHRPGDPDPGDLGIIMKSTDGGKIWRSKDLSGGPTTTDWDAGGCVTVNDTIHVLAETGGPSDVVYNNFRMSDHASPDTWGNIDDLLDGATGDTGQACAIVYRPTEGDFIAFYNTNKGTNDRVTFRIGTFGSWSTPVDIDTEASTNFYLCAAVLGTTDPDLVHCFYKDDTNSEINHRTIDNLDALGTIHVVETNASATTGRYGTSRAISWDNSGTEEVMILVFDETDEKMYSVVISNDGTPDSRKAASGVAVSEHGAGSDRPDCDLIIDPDTNTAYMLYADKTTRDLWIDKAINDAGWGTDEEIIDAVVVPLMKGEVFTHSSGNGGDKVLGYLYENSEFGEGFTGGIWYGEYLISAAATELPFKKTNISQAVTRAATY